MYLTSLTIIQSDRSNNVKCVLVFLSTHSNPESGDLHIEQGGGLTVPEVIHYFHSNMFMRLLCSFFSVIFGAELPALAKSTQSLLILLTCGGVYSNIAPFGSIRDFAQMLVHHQLRMSWD
jgi:hypothetical protein